MNVVAGISSLCALLLCASCARPNELRPLLAPSAAAPSADVAARLKRIEHGLAPEVRVNGEPRGWSIEERLRAHHTPGVSVAIIHDYRVVAAKAYGVADASTGVRLTETTRMQAASVTKMFTALAALKAVEAGKLPLDADVNRTLRSWKLPENAWTRATPVTLKHLLSHTAGTNVPSVMRDGRAPTALELLQGEPPAITPPVRVDFAPGTKFRYSGGGTTIVQQLLLDVEGRPFPEIIRDRVLAPLGLTHSAIGDADRGASVSAGHDFDATVETGDLRPWMGAGAAGLWTTPTDVARLLVEVQLGLAGRSEVVSKAIATQMTTPVRSTGEGDAIATSLGTFIEKHGTGVYFGHDGLGIGFMAMARASTTDGNGAVVMANGQGAAPLMMEILRSIAAEYAWSGWLPPPIELAPVDSARLAAFAGRYGGESSEALRVVAKGDRLEVRQPFRDPLELLPVGSDVFVSRDDAARFTFSTDAAGGVRSLLQTPPPWPPAHGTVERTRLPDDAAEEPLELLHSGRVDEALAAGKRLLQQHPNEPRVSEPLLGSIGEDLLYRQLDATRALAVFELNLALHPQSPMATVNVAEALFRAGRRGEAEPFSAQAKALFARDTAMGELARIYFLWKVARVKALEVK